MPSSATDVPWLLAFEAGSGHLDALDDASPSDLMSAHLAWSGLMVAATRTENPIHERERPRFSLLARLAAPRSVIDPVP